MYCLVVCQIVCFEMGSYFVDSVSQELCYHAWLKSTFLVSDSARHGHVSELCQCNKNIVCGGSRMILKGKPFREGCCCCLSGVFLLLS